MRIPMTRRARTPFWFALTLTLSDAIALIAIFTDTLPSVEMAAWIAVLAWACTFANLVRRSTHGVLSLPCGYLGLLGLFHLGLVVPACLGFEPSREARWLFSESTPKALLLCLIAFASFGLGALLAGRVSREQFPQHFKVADGGPGDDHSPGLLLGGIALGILGVVCLTAGASRMGMFEVLYYDFFALRELEDPRLFGVGYMFATMGMVIAGVGATARQLRFVSLGSVAVFAPLFLYGFRGHLIVYFIAFLMVWDKKEPRVARQVAVAAVLFILVLSPAVRLLRSGQSANLSEAAASVGAFDLVTEAGGSLRPLVETVDALDYDNSGFWFGASYLGAFARVIPNLSTQWAAPEARRTTDPAAWITSRVEPLTFRTGGGIGYSGVAEPYLNFGPVGVVAFFMLLGFILAAVDERRPGIYARAVTACAYAALLWTVRNDFSNLVRPAVWAAAVVGVLYLLLAARRLHFTAGR